jgi:hypothetical protein
MKPRPGRALGAYRERIFVAVRVPDFQVTLRCNNGTEMKGHMQFAISKKLACQIFRSDPFAAGILSRPGATGHSMATART